MVNMEIYEMDSIAVWNKKMSLYPSSIGSIWIRIKILFPMQYHVSPPGGSNL